MLAKDQYQLLLEAAYTRLGESIADRHRWSQVYAKELEDKRTKFTGTSAIDWTGNIVSAAKTIVAIGKACSEPVALQEQYRAAEEVRCSD